MELVQKQIHTHVIGKKVADQFYIDDDLNVPDAKDDIGRIVVGKGKLSVEELQKMENYVRLSGNLYYTILYVTESGDPHLSSLEGKLPFEEMIYVEDGEESQYHLLHASAECSISLIHSRKLSLRAMAEVEIGNDRIQDIALPLDVESDVSLYKKKQDLQVLTLHTMKKDTYRIKEEMMLSGTKENIGTLLWSDVESRKLDTKLGQDELNISGELMVFCLYESPEGKMDWVEQILPYNGRVECSNVDASMYHHIRTMLEDVNVDVKMDEDGEMRTLGIEGTLQLQIAVYEEDTVEVLTDMYSIEKECRIERQEAVLEKLLIQNHLKCKLTEQLSLPELREDVLQICCNSGRVEVDRMETVAEGIQIEGILHLRFLYVKESDEVPFAVWQGMIPFSYLLECEAMTENASYEIQPALEQLSVSLMGGGDVEVKAVLAFHSLIKQPINEEMMTDFFLDEPELDGNKKTPGIIGYLVKDGEELWDLAKRYHTTTDRLKEVNGLETDVIKVGDRILIFQENMSIL